MKKALMMASVASMIDLFNMENIQILRDLGFDVEVACNFQHGSITSQDRVDEFKEELVRDNFKVHHIPVPRSIFAFRDIVRSYKMMKKLCNENSYETVHCHSPIGGLVARLACIKARNKGTNVIYTAHGFHFYKGAPLINWLVYYPIERYLSRFTDVLITINKEDYALAKKKMSVKNIEYVPGVGIDLNKFAVCIDDRDEKREMFGIKHNEIVLISVGELNQNKNHQLVIKAIARLKNEKIKYLVVGVGPLREYLEELTHKLGVSHQVCLIGYRGNIPELLNASNIFCFPSKREGLSVALMEAMACGLPIICSRIRGNVDLVDESGGVFFDPNSEEDCEKAIKKMLQLDYMKLGMYNQERVKKFDIKLIQKKMKSIYENSDSVD